MFGYLHRLCRCLLGRDTAKGQRPFWAGYQQAMDDMDELATQNPDQRV
jgi:hypothetical protein